MFLPASKFTVSPGLTNVSVAVPVAVVELVFQPELLIASTTVLTLASLLPSSVVATPSVDVMLPMIVESDRLTSTWILFTVPSVSDLIVVPLPFANSTVSYGLTKSRSPLSAVFKFQPAFSTSPRVAALVVVAVVGSNVPLVVSTGSVVFRLLITLVPFTVPIVIGPKTWLPSASNVPPITVLLNTGLVAIWIWI